VDVGLVGLPGSGKTTVFNLLTGAGVGVAAFGGGRPEAHRALARVPDARLDALADIYHPRKVTPAQIQVVDIPGQAPGQGEGPNRLLADVRQVDALVHVIRGFTDPLGVAPDAPAAAADLELELALADLDLLERRRDKLTGGRKMTSEARAELPLVERLIAVLEGGGRLDQAGLRADEAAAMRGYQFLTLKPMLWVVNLDDDAMSRGDWPDRGRLMALAADKGVPVVEMAGRFEMEVMSLDEGEREMFLGEISVAETGIARLAAAVYSHLGLISFLTAGEDEVRAWTIARGTTARTAAGKIHSDIERGFIRAEVVPFSALAEWRSLAAARDHGQVRMEGRDYVMQDGDVVNFRFNV
jgi:GTP-binding protein YchF